MEPVETLQAKLVKLYTEKLTKYSGGLKLSVPHMPRVSKRYLETRIIVVGQETNTWYLETNDDFLNVFLKSKSIETACLVNRYDKFIVECAQGYGGKFWDFSRKLYTNGIISGDMIENNELSHCWMNLFVSEACCSKTDKNGCPTQNKKLAKEIIALQDDLLFESFKILDPKKIIFLTGHPLDGYLRANGLGTQEISVKNIDKKDVLTCKEACEIKIINDTHPLFGCKCIRLYHPTYFLGRINTYKAISNRLKSDGINLSVSNYYAHVVFEFLKNW